MSGKPTAYEGRDNYIFVSYAHSDREQVFEVLYELEKNGYRFWYDEGITPGAEWAEDIARHLMDSSAVMAFITKTSVDSDNCRREITYALSKDKPVIGVILEKTEMSAGLELQLSAQQNVIRYNYSTYEAFIGKLLSSQGIEQCREQPEAGTEEAEARSPEDLASELFSSTPQEEAEATKRIDKFYTLYRKNEEFQKILDREYEKFKAAGALVSEPEPETGGITAAEISGDQEMIRQSEPAPKKDAQSKEKPAKSKRKTSAATASAGANAAAIKKPRKITIALAAVALIILLAVIGNTMTTYKATWGEKYKKNEDILSIDDVTIQQKDIDSFSKFKTLYVLRFHNCDFSQCDLSGFLDKNRKYKLDFEDCTGISDYSFLNGQPLSYLWINNAEEFSDLSQLNLDELLLLDVTGTSVSDLSSLTDAPKLSSLHISSTDVKNIDPVLTIPSLRHLTAGNCDLAPIGTQCAALELAELDLHNTGISDMSVFSDCTRLEKIDLSGNTELTDMTWLNDQNSSTLTDLDVSQTGLDKDDLSFIQGYRSLEILELVEVPTDNLNFCSNLTGLETICAEGCGINDISGLSKCLALNKIGLGFNEISDISPLKGIVEKHTDENSSGIDLDISFNKISDVSSLGTGTYNYLILFGNDQNVASTVPENSVIDYLCIDWFEGITDAWYAGAEGVRNIYLAGTPQDEKLRTEDAFIGLDLIMTTYDDIYNSTAFLVYEFRKGAKLYAAREQ